MDRTGIAVISDIHGNIWALEAVLADIRRREIERIINLGDCFYGPLLPGVVAERLAGSAMVTVRGNGDRRLVTAAADEPNPTVRYAKAQLNPEQLAWLGDLPPTLVYESEIFLCHGTPTDDHTYLLEEVDGATTRPRTPGQIQRYLDGTAQRLILCAHSHIPRVVYLADGRIIVNPGSVGLPAFDDDSPHYFTVESGSPHAKYAVISQKGDGWQVEQVFLEYDWQRAAAQAKSNHRGDWAKWLQTGRV